MIPPRPSSDLRREFFPIAAAAPICHFLSAAIRISSLARRLLLCSRAGEHSSSDSARNVNGNSHVADEKRPALLSGACACACSGPATSSIVARLVGGREGQGAANTRRLGESSGTRSRISARRGPVSRQDTGTLAWRWRRSASGRGTHGCRRSEQSSLRAKPSVQHIEARRCTIYLANTARFARSGSGLARRPAAPPLFVYEDIYDAKTAVDHLSGFNVANRYLIVLYYQQSKISKKVDLKKKEDELARMQEKYGISTSKDK
ncbi:hypothetical protein KFK09_002123 [Dendrobium nobile]|uniref:Uncharacterized protein n=1 Tax=Dendrobium nobile TaxID=94219 RepID=A0A8T3CC40_DENNO|nr:hypothetical protein KFK09_002123 [Dendrobium nobile]